MGGRINTGKCSYAALEPPASENGLRERWGIMTASAYPI